MNTFTRATQSDLDEIRSFWNAHVVTSMFPLVNLRDHGLCGETPRALNLWVLRQAGISGVLAITNEGMLMPQLPDMSDADWQGAADILRNRSIKGAIGAAEQVRALIKACGLGSAPTRLNEDEPGFELDLRDLIVPPHEQANLRPITPSDTLVIDWRAAYHREALGTPDTEADMAAQNDVESYLASGNYRLLFVQGNPVCFSGFNAALSDIVQIGGVYVPPHLRRRGYARLAVALHLAEARQAGIKRACLFAANAAAAKGYKAIGFRQTGDISLVLFDTDEGAGS